MFYEALAGKPGAYRPVYLSFRRSRLGLRDTFAYHEIMKTLILQWSPNYGPNRPVRQNKPAAVRPIADSARRYAVPFDDALRHTVTASPDEMRTFQIIHLNRKT